MVVDEYTSDKRHEMVTYVFVSKSCMQINYNYPVFERQNGQATLIGGAVTLRTTAKREVFIFVLKSPER